MSWSTDLSPRLVLVQRTAARHGDQPGSEHAGGRGVPGVGEAGGYREGAIPGTNPAVPYEAYLTYSEINRLIRPFD